jgi:hypothetical protein
LAIFITVMSPFTSEKDSFTSLSGQRPQIIGGSIFCKHFVLMCDSSPLLPTAHWNHFLLIWWLPVFILHFESTFLILKK